MNTIRSAFFLLIFMIAAACAVFADFNAELYKADLLDLQGDYDGEKALLLSLSAQAGNNTQKAEVYWRLSRTYLQFGDEKKLAGASSGVLLSLFEQGIRYAEMAIKHDPDGARGYFWKASNSGLWGQAKGILESLQKAEEMKGILFVAIAYDPCYSGSYYVLAQLYDQVPGWPISFGSIDIAVSLARKAIAVHKQNLADGEYDVVYFDFYIELAKYLWTRNWDARKRKREQENKCREYSGKSATAEKYCYYEGVIDIKNVSDRQEAEQLLNWALSELEKINPKYPFQEKALAKAKKVKRGWR